MQRQNSTLRSLQTIIESGGHFVLVKRGEKRPVWSRWQDRKPSTDVLLSHGGRLGLIPASIGCTALDVDQGDPRDLPRPVAQYRTQRQRGAHLYYGDHERRGNRDWSGLGCSGEIRSAKGYCILHGDGLHRVAKAIESGVQFDLFPFPEELLEIARATLVTPDRATFQDAMRRPAAASLQLESVLKGARHTSLFDAVRLWAYRQPRGTDLRAWTCRVQRFAFTCNRRFHQPIETSHALDCAYSVATWIWSEFSQEFTPRRGAALDHSSSVAQAWRGTWGGRAIGRVAAA